MKVFVVGSGAREEALRDALKDHLCDDIDAAGLVVIGPEQPLCEGLADELRAKDVKVIGVDKKFSRLESSKLFAKEFMAKYGFKTPKVIARAPFVVKQDGLCGGKGVRVVHRDCFVEEYLEGEEISVMSLFDGKTLLNFVPARDFKRLSAAQNSPNTGGMGAYCPVNLTPEQEQRLQEYLKKLEAALVAEKADFTGFIYSGLIWSKNEWYVLEYNVRPGDPEAQVILNHLKTDFFEVLRAALEQRLGEINLKYKEGYTGCLTVAAQGYPAEPVKGDEINLPQDERVKVYFAGVKELDGKLYSNGGRVLSLCTTSSDPFPVLKSFADKIKMAHKYYRDDVNIS